MDQCWRVQQEDTYTCLGEWVWLFVLWTPHQSTGYLSLMLLAVWRGGSAVPGIGRDRYHLVTCWIYNMHVEEGLQCSWHNSYLGYPFKIPTSLRSWVIIFTNLGVHATSLPTCPVRWWHYPNTLLRKWGKKPLLDPAVLTNYRLFISKDFERVAVKQLTNYLYRNGLFGEF